MLNAQGVSSLSTMLPALLVVLAGTTVFLGALYNSYIASQPTEADSLLDDADSLISALESSDALCLDGRSAVFDGDKVLSLSDSDMNSRFHISHSFYVRLSDVSDYRSAVDYTRTWNKIPEEGEYTHMIVRSVPVLICASPEESHAAVLEVGVWS